MAYGSVYKMTAATVVFDPFSQDFFNSPYEMYRQMRVHAPVYYSEQYDFYALTRHEDVAAAFKDYETYSSAYGVDLAQVRKDDVTEHGSIIAMDPPAHRRMRSLLNKVFTPRAIQSKRELVTELIDKHLSAVDPAGFDFVQDFSARFPVDVMTTLQGVPEGDRQQIRLWIDDLLHREAGEIEMGEEGIKSAVDMAIYYFRLIKKRRHELGDDLISQLIESEIERDNGEMEPLTNIEITEFATLLGGAGAETVTKLLGNAAVVFAQNPGEWQKLLDDRSKVPLAVEELLRYEAPAQYNVRRSMREIELHGVTIPAGKPVFLVGGSANRDPEAWTEPDRFDIDRDRSQAQNLGLGYGIHSCLGAALARLESVIALDKMLDFMPRYEVDWDGCKRVNMQNVAGWSNVPVRVLD
ncbi:cytochrome P450 [Mycolicibacterium vulneris]|nr:cytochrome P450 [Mycolicibacterium vulneris]